MTQYEPSPSWFDPALEELLAKKRDRSGMPLYDRTLDWAVRQLLKTVVPREMFNTHKHTWADVESLIRKGTEDIQLGYTPEVIIGIKSGGALIARYVAQCLGVSMVGYMKVSHYSDASQSIARTITKMGQQAVVKEPCVTDVAGKKILLVDDQTATGLSLETGKEHLLEKGASKVKTYCLFAKDPMLVDYFTSHGLGVYFPWGKDA